LTFFLFRGPRMSFLLCVKSVFFPYTPPSVHSPSSQQPDFVKELTPVILRQLQQRETSLIVQQDYTISGHPRVYNSPWFSQTRPIPLRLPRPSPPHQVILPATTPPADIPLFLAHSSPKFFFPAVSPEFYHGPVGSKTG